MSSRLRVVNPLGEQVARVVESRGVLTTLNGKRVGEVWNGGFQGQESFPIIRTMLKARYPDVTIVPYTEFPTITVPDLAAEVQAKNLEAVGRVLVEKGCDAVITGNGG